MKDAPETTAIPAEALAEFPGAGEGLYLSSCTRGLLPLSARKAVDALLDDRVHGTSDKAGLFETVERARGRFAQLIRAEADEIAITKNVSEGLSIIAAALEWRPGDNVIVCMDIEHPNNMYPWYNLRERAGIEVRAVPTRDGHIPTDAMIDAMDDRTRLVTVSTVSFSPGFRTDVEPLGRACREKGVFLLADGVQSVGIIDTDVQKLGVDALAVSTQKGLLGLYGFGFLYCRRQWAERLRPVYLARFGVDLGEGAHEAAKGSDQYDLMPGARRFDLGNYNYPGAAAADAALELINRVGTPAIEAHVTALSHRLARASWSSACRWPAANRANTWAPSSASARSARGRTIPPRIRASRRSTSTWRQTASSSPSARACCAWPSTSTTRKTRWTE